MSAKHLNQMHASYFSVALRTALCWSAFDVSHDALCVLYRIAMKRPGSAEGQGLFGSGSASTSGTAALKPLAPPPGYFPQQVRHSCSCAVTGLCMPSAAILCTSSCPTISLPGRCSLTCRVNSLSKLLLVSNSQTAC